MKRLRPSEAPALDPPRFAHLFGIAVNAGESASPDAAAGTFAVDVGAPDAGAMHLPAEPYARAALALRRELGDEEETILLSALWRFRALMALVSKDALGPWVLAVADHGAPRSRLHPAVLDVAATARLARNGHFPARKFVRAVETTAQALYPQLAGWPPD